MRFLVLIILLVHATVLLQKYNAVKYEISNKPWPGVKKCHLSENLFMFLFWCFSGCFCCCRCLRGTPT